MAESAPTYVSELVKHMKCLTETDEYTLLDLAVENMADAAAEKLGLKQGITMISSNLNKLAKLRRHASRVHFAKIHLE